MVKILIILSMLLLTTPAKASMEFQQIAGDKTTEFIYKRPSLPDLSFKLDNSKIAGQFSNKKKYSAELAQQHIRHQVLLASVKLQQKGVRIRLSPSNLPLAVTISGGDLNKVASIRQQLSQTQSEAFDSYLKRDYQYLLKTQLGESYVIPDHVRVMRESLAVMQPVASSFVALYGRNNIRKLSAQIAQWIQQIPYQTLSNRRESAGAGFSGPVQLLQANSGDCDSKAVLFAAVLRNIFPKLGLGIVYFNDHAVVAAQIPALENELTVNLNDANYLLLDPTGPAIMPLGTLNPPYDAQLQSRQFSYRLF